MTVPSPFVVGCDLAGTVEKVGPNADRFRVGERVWGSNQGLLGRQGTFAEYAAVDEKWLYSTPEGVSDSVAAAASLVGITAHLGLFQNASLQPGEIVFVNGGSGGVGSTVVQMAKAVGAKVITTAGSASKCNACKTLGADLVINYKEDDIGASVEGFAPEGVNVWWETTREPNFHRIVGSLAQRGRIVLMAGRTATPEFPVGPFYVKNCSMHGFAMFLATPEEQRKCSVQINEWLSNGKLNPRIDRTLPLSETVQAHQLQEANTLNQAGTLSGKIVLTP